MKRVTSPLYMHTHHTTHTELEHIVKGSHEHVVEVMRQKHVAVADLGFGRVRAQGMGGSTHTATCGGRRWDAVSLPIW